MNTENFISILITNYNKENFLEKSLHAACNQNFQNYEIILFDDCSKDNSIEIKSLKFNRNVVKMGKREFTLRQRKDSRFFK